MSSERTKFVAAISVADSTEVSKSGLDKDGTWEDVEGVGVETDKAGRKGSEGVSVLRGLV